MSWKLLRIYFCIYVDEVGKILMMFNFFRHITKTSTMLFRQYLCWILILTDFHIKLYINHHIYIPFSFMISWSFRWYKYFFTVITILLSLYDIRNFRQLANSIRLPVIFFAINQRQAKKTLSNEKSSFRNLFFLLKSNAIREFDRNCTYRYSIELNTNDWPCMHNAEYYVYIKILREKSMPRSSDKYLFRMRLPRKS